MTGRVTVSLDFECGWGVIGNNQWKAREAGGVYRELRPVLKKFLNCLDAAELPCTWAVVGAMVENPNDRCFEHLTGEFGKKVKMFNSVSESQTNDGRDLLDTVLASVGHHRFGVHTYSHLLFSEYASEPNVILEDLNKSIAVNNALGLGSDFFVFPENRSGSFDLVKTAGIKTVRMHAFNSNHPDIKRHALRRVMESWFRPVSPVCEVRADSGLMLHYASELINWGEGASSMKVELTKRRVRHAVESASKGEHVHFWFHPFDLVSTPGLFDFVKEVVDSITRYQHQGKIEVSTV